MTSKNHPGQKIRNTGTNQASKRVNFHLPVWLMVLVSVAVFLPQQSQAETAKRHIAIVETMTLPVIQKVTGLYQEKMAQLGHIDGESIRYTILNGEGEPGQARQLLSDLLTADRPDLVLSIATIASRDTRDLLADTKTPQVFLLVSDPVKEGFVSTIGHPSGSNIAGQTQTLSMATKISLVSQAIGPGDHPRRIGLLYSTYPSSDANARRILHEQHKHKNMDFIPLHFQFAPGTKGRKVMRDSAVEAITRFGTDLDAIWIATGPAANDPEFIQAVQTTTRPVIYAENMDSVKAGAMIAMLSSMEANAAAGAAITHDIFNGEFAGDIPVLRPDRFRLGLNIRTARQLNVTIPSHILKLAGENLFK